VAAVTDHTGHRWTFLPIRDINFKACTTNIDKIIQHIGGRGKPRRWW